MSERVLPYYKWFWQDYRANRKVQRMSYIERGLYRELLDECWAEGSIPSDMAELADICGCPEQVMTDAWQMLGKCFVLLGDRFINEKMEDMRTERDQIRVLRAEIGSRGGRAKAAKTQDSVANAKQTDGNSHIEEKRRVREEKEKRTPAKRSISVDNIAETTILPPQVPREIWRDWVQFRSEIRKPMTERAAEEQVRFLCDCIRKGQDPVEVIRQSIRQQWQGLFELKGSQPRQQKQESFYERDQRLKRQEAAKWGGAPTADFMTIDAEVQHVPAIEGD